MVDRVIAAQKRPDPPVSFVVTVPEMVASGPLNVAGEIEYEIIVGAMLSPGELVLPPTLEDDDDVAVGNEGAM